MTPGRLENDGVAISSATGRLPLTDKRQATAKRVAAKLGVQVND
jgi:hypothetical protein